MKLEHLVTYHADLRPPQEVGAVPSGTRSIHDVTGGTFEGPRLKGTILPSGGDWLVTGNDGVGRLDVRATLQTHDGALIYVQYYGVIVLDEAANAKLAAGQGTDYGELHFFTQPRMETGDPRYAWVNRVVAVGEGRVVPGGVEYRVYQAVNG